MAATFDSEGDEYSRFESLARKVVDTPKPKPSAAPAGESAGEPPDGSAEREEDDGDG